MVSGRRKATSVKSRRPVMTEGGADDLYIGALGALRRRLQARARRVPPPAAGAAHRIESLPTGHRAARQITEVIPLAAQERARILDESLPVGLQIRGKNTSTPE